MRAIFTLSTGRVGTKCLSRVLGCSPEVASYHENHPMTCKHARAEARRGIYRFGPRECGCPLLWTADPLRVPHRRPKMCNADDRGLVYSETGWGLMFYAPLFLDRLGDVRFIHLVRDPRTWTLSHIQDGPPVDKSHGATICPPDDPMSAVYWGEWLPAQRSLWWWAEVNWWALRFAAAHPGRVHLLRHEDMITGDVADLFAALDLDYDQAQVDTVVETKWNTRSGPRPTWQDGWAQWLDADLMARFGYE